MIIDTNGSILNGWLRKNGPVVEDSDNPYKMQFGICLRYNDLQKNQFAQIKQLKKNLEATDYKALKYADGVYTEEQYAPIKAQRAEWRRQINEIEKDFVEPTITRAEMDEAERKAMELIKADIERQTGKEVVNIQGS